jgi:hypothetical protein
MIYTKGKNIYGYGLNPIYGIVAQKEVKEGQLIPAGSIVKNNYGETGGSFDNSDRNYSTGQLLGTYTGTDKIENGIPYVQIEAITISRTNSSLFNWGAGLYFPMTIKAWFVAAQTTDSETVGIELITDTVEKQRIANANLNNQPPKPKDSAPATATTEGLPGRIDDTSNKKNTYIIAGIGIVIIGIVAFLTKKSKK